MKRGAKQSEIPYISIYRHTKPSTTFGKNGYFTSQIYMPEATYIYLNKPKELSFLLDAKGNPTLRFPDIDTKISVPVRTGKSLTWGNYYRLGIKSIDESLYGRYEVELEDGIIYLTKVE